MIDNKTTLNELKSIIKKFNDEREWNQFHTPKNLSMLIATEAAELMELFLWSESKNSYETFKNKTKEVEDEIADIVIGALCFANATNIDLVKAITKKIKKNAKKYPLKKAKGRCLKYHEL